MDGTTFHRLSQRFGRAASRRGLLGLLAALPLAGAVMCFDHEDSEAAGRRRRRKKRHKHQRGDDKRHRKGEQKGDARRKRRCAALGEAPDQTRQACCTGLSLDSNGRCATPTSPPPPPPPSAPCVPQCDGKTCGPDGCGSVCGACDSLSVCSTSTCDEGRCVLTPIAGCCQSDADCDDGNPCTLDTCQTATCQHPPAAAGTACTRGGGEAGICDAVGQCSRHVVMRTFANPAAITIRDRTAGSVAADLYPANIEVSGFTNGVITDVNVHLSGFRISFPNDVDILLSAAHIPGLNAIIMSDSCAIPGHYSDVNLVLDDQAALPLPASEGLDSGSGTFQPANNVDVWGSDDFPTPAPTPSGNSQLSTFNGQNPNGTWQLWVVDDVGGLSPWGLEGGWALEITAEVDA